MSLYYVGKRAKLFMGAAVKVWEQMFGEVKKVDANLYTRNQARKLLN